MALVSAVFCAGSAQASVAYNLTGWDTTGAGGLDGGVPANWVGSSSPNYTGSLNAMWFADLSMPGIENVSSTDARNKGTDTTFALAVGPKAWSSNATGTLGKGHGADYGLIHLSSPGDLTISVAADTSLASTLIPGFSLFSGWDTGTTADRLLDYQNNQNNPLNTVGLSFLHSASTTIAGGSASYNFTNLAAGDYTLFIGGNATASLGTAGKYAVTLSASPVPIPAAMWLFGSALFGWLGINRKGTLSAI